MIPLIIWVKVDMPCALKTFTRHNDSSVALKLAPSGKTT